MIYLGLISIITAWLIQFYSKSDKVQQKFVLVYIVGVLLIVIDGFMNGSGMIAFFNLLSCIAAILVLLRLRK